MMKTKTLQKIIYEINTKIRQKFKIDFINVEKRSKFNEANKNVNYAENGNNNSTIQNYKKS